MFKIMRRAQNREDGFTLIELMVVVMIIAILIAIAIPSFLGFRRNAQDREAQSNLRTVLLAQNSIHLENGAFTNTDQEILDFEANARLGDEPGWVSIELHDPDLCLQATSASDAVFAVYQVAGGATYYGTAACPESAGAPASADWSQVGWGGTPVEDDET